MPIKNYTTKQSVDQSAKAIQKVLVEHGARSIQFDYEQGTGRIEALKFLLPFQGRDVAFRLPTEWRKFQAVLKQQGVPRANDDDYCARVAWRNIRDWIEAQMALYETQMVELPQIFLPYAMQGNQTLYEFAAKNLLNAPE